MLNVSFGISTSILCKIDIFYFILNAFCDIFELVKNFAC